MVKQNNDNNCYLLSFFLLLYKINKRNKQSEQAADKNGIEKTVKKKYH